MAGDSGEAARVLDAGNGRAKRHQSNLCVLFVLFQAHEWTTTVTLNLRTHQSLIFGSNIYNYLTSALQVGVLDAQRCGGDRVSV
jgi:hypothetical protein